MKKRKWYGKIFKKFHCLLKIISSLTGYVGTLGIFSEAGNYVAQTKQAVFYAGFFGWGGSIKCWGGSYFSRVERNFTIGQSPQIWGNFSKICIKINNKLKNYWETSRKNANFSENFLILGRP